MFLFYLVVFLCIAYYWSKFHGDWKSRTYGGTSSTYTTSDGAQDNPASLFDYQPLSSTTSLRLIHILPRGPSGPAKISIQEYVDVPSYSCLSYVWGNDTTMRHISVNGRKFPVRQNLYDFLHSDYARVGMLFWIDALSINQEDLMERNQQVQRMNDIYSQATEVCIWLGTKDRYFKLIRWLGKPKWKEPSPKVMSQLKAFIYSNYWERAWITQEVLLARSVRILHPDGEINWGRVGNLDQTLKEHGHSFAHAIRTTHPLMLWRWQNDRSTLLDMSDGLGGAETIFWGVLGRRVKAKCLDPRDRIYSLIALDEQASKIRVNYQESAVDLFWRAGQHLDAWSNPNRIRTLRGALGLDYTDLRRSMADRPNDSITIPVRHAYTSSSLHSWKNSIIACKNGHVRHTFPHPRTSRHDILLCPITQGTTYDDTRNTHALIQPTLANDDTFTITLSHQIVFKKGWKADPIQIDICHLKDDKWVPITSWAYLQKSLKPESPEKTPARWVLQMPFKWVVYCTGMEERSPEPLLQLPTVESDQFSKQQRRSWFTRTPSNGS